jgi:hypothetical protein
LQSKGHFKGREVPLRNHYHFLSKDHISSLMPAALFTVVSAAGWELGFSITKEKGCGCENKVK